MTLDDNVSECIQGTLLLIGVVSFIYFIMWAVSASPEKTKFDDKDCVVVQEQLYCEVDKE